jgi:hypothetical protein
MIEVQCPVCSRTINVNDSYAGKQGKCQGCGTILTVPAAGSPSSVAGASAASQGSPAPVQPPTPVPQQAVYSAPPTGPAAAPPHPEEVVPPLTCAVCGTQLPRGVQFCLSCGTSLANPAATGLRSPAPVAPSRPEVSVRRGWWESRSHGQIVGIMAAIVIAVAVVTGVVTHMATATPREDQQAAQQDLEVATQLLDVQRGKAQDAAAKSLVRNAMTAIESAYVDSRTFDVAVMTPAMLEYIEPSIAFVFAADSSAAIAPTAEASVGTVDYFGTAVTYAVGSMSQSGRSFGVIVDKGAGGGNTFYIDGVETNW